LSDLAVVPARRCPTGGNLEPSRSSAKPQEPAMVTVVLVPVVVRLVAVVRHDRSLSAPRSHTHELDPQSVR